MQGMAHFSKNSVSVLGITHIFKTKLITSNVLSRQSEDARFDCDKIFLGHPLLLVHFFYKVSVSKSTWIKVKKGTV